MKRHDMKRALVVLVGLVLLAGCSGDGGDSPSPPPSAQAPLDPNLTVPVQAAFANIVNKGLNQAFTISGSIDNSTANNPIPPTPITGNGHFLLGTGRPNTLCDFAVSQAVQVATGTTIANGVSTLFSTASTVYYRGDNTIVATDSAGQLFLFTPVAFPATVRAGDTGVTGTGTEVSANCTQVPFGATITGAYYVASDSATSLLVTFVEENKPIAGGVSQATTVYRIDTSGNVSLVSVTTTQSLLGSVYQTVVFTF